MEDHNIVDCFLEKRRSVRRHHKDRIKIKIKKRLDRWGWSKGRQTDKIVGKMMSTPHPCSCPMCGNKRSYEGSTLQERKFELDYLEGLEDIKSIEDRD